ncbi:MAG: DUF1638 domain-containing protein [Verrucomicrobiae bacterium]|nr:DUF1638 domain-containing protein [Verrucomicrobiae bacterium]NNJ42235.1 DUF1638 domain-containing protein [Akkermansiaceae bacterium]
MGLHDRPDILRSTLQEEINQIDDIDAIILAYGLCGCGTAGLHSKNTASSSHAATTASPFFSAPKNATPTTRKTAPTTLKPRPITPKNAPTDLAGNFNVFQVTPPPKTTWHSSTPGKKPVNGRCNDLRSKKSPEAVRPDQSPKVTQPCFLHG